jgi:very-short-patch-repair endonuclease
MPIKNIVIGQSVSSEMYACSKELRREMTSAEKILWRELKANKLNGHHFRRQQIIDRFLVDFYCHQQELIVEVDGSIHDLQKEYDAEREAYLIERGFRILRFSNEEVESNIQSVLRKILSECKPT